MKKLLAGAIFLLAFDSAMASNTPLTVQVDRTVNPSPVCVSRITSGLCTPIGTISTAGVWTPNGPSGVAYAPSAYTDTTNASNISSGTLAGARLPTPTTSVRGGVLSATAPANQFATGISTTGLPTFAQPGFANLSGTITSAQVPSGLTLASPILTGTPSTPALTGYLYGNGGTGWTAATTIPTLALSGVLQAAQSPAYIGDVVSAAGSLTMTIQPGAVTSTKMASGAALGNLATNSVDYTKDAQSPAATFSGNPTGATANRTDMTSTQAASLLPPCVGDTGTGGTEGMVPAPPAGSAASGYVLGAGCNWVSGGGGGGQVRYQYVNSGSTWTPPSGTSSATVFNFTLIGGGGGSGGAGTGAFSNSGGGGAGGEVIVALSGLSSATAYSLTIGSAGSAGTSTGSGGGGGTTSLTVGANTYSAAGGQGSAYYTFGTANAGPGGVGGGFSGPATIGIQGQAGGSGVGFSSGAGLGGYGGNTILGAGGSPSLNSVGKAATGCGSGASGAGYGGNAGAAGAAGCMTVEWVQ